jgi:DNA (cytosine-5)-methyltransferase 1
VTVTYGSLFSGIGGFDLGFDLAGMEGAWQCEIDEAASSVLSQHWPGVPNYKDVRNVTGQSPAVDVICGGFPCQDVSVAGKRAGLAGKRSGLWFEFHRILGELAPRWVVVENVPGLLSSNGGADFAVILQGLVELGYGIAWRILDAQYFGLAQRRRRVFIVGSLGDGRAAQVLFEREGLPGDIAPRREAGTGIAASITAGAHPGGHNGQDDHKEGRLIVFEPRFARNGRGAPDTIAPPLKAQSGQMGKGDGAPVVAGLVTKGNGEAFLTDKHTSLSTGGGQAGQGYPAALTGSGVRRLTPTECERLQGFPDGWTGGQSDSKRYRQLGNAVAVPVAEWLGRRLLEAIGDGVT